MLRGAAAIDREGSSAIAEPAAEPEELVTLGAEGQQRVDLSDETGTDGGRLGEALVNLRAEGQQRVDLGDKTGTDGGRRGEAYVELVNRPDGDAVVAIELRSAEHLIQPLHLDLRLGREISRGGVDLLELAGESGELRFGI